MDHDLLLSIRSGLVRFLCVCVSALALFALVLFAQLTVVEGYPPTVSGMRQFYREWKAYHAGNAQKP